MPKIIIESDTRLDWRDPEMPILQTEQLVDNWTGKVVDQRTVTLTPQQAQYNAECRLMQSQFNPQDNPSWRDDPTYNLRRKR